MGTRILTESKQGKGNYEKGPSTVQKQEGNTRPWEKWQAQA